MNALLSLWLPILLSAVTVFVISSLIHMVFKWHASDYGQLANEDAIRDSIRAGQPKPGRYVIPFCQDLKDMAGAAMVKKYQEGPIGHLTIGPNGAPKMGKPLGLWFVWSLVIAIIAGYLAVRFVPMGDRYALRALKLTGAVTFIAHGFGTVQESIWMMRPWSSTLRHLVDAGLYALGTGLLFYWLWQ